MAPMNQAFMSRGNTESGDPNHGSTSNGGFHINFANNNMRSNNRANETSLIVGRKSQSHVFVPSNRSAFSSINSARNVKNDGSASPKFASGSNGRVGNSSQKFMSMNRAPIENTLVIGKKNHNASQVRLSSMNYFNGSGVEPKLSSSPLKESDSDLPRVDYSYMEPVQLQVRFHETRTSDADVFLDLSLVPGAKEGDIGELESVETSSKKLYFVFKKDPTKPNSNNMSNNVNNSNNIINNNSQSTNTANNIANNYLSIQSGVIPTLMDLKLRSQVLVRLKNKADAEADVVEIYIKDIHLSRGDMWNLQSILTGNCLYKSQKVSFLHGSIRGTVNRIYKNGKKLFSTYVGENTKIVFRSESARLVFFIQTSSEMWHFEESGQLMFHKLMNSLFPKILQRWKELGTNHLITIVLFSSVDMESDGSVNWSPGEIPDRKDYYRVVVDQANIVLWNEIMAALRLEFANFERDIKIQLNTNKSELNPQEYIIKGRFLPSVKGNLLEAINLGSSLVSDDFRDPDLRHTTSHFVVISPGTGIFDVDYDMLLKTSKLMSRIDLTIDVICLSQPPLHVVPLFRYLDHQRKLQYCIPSWMDISFWNDSSHITNQWVPRCKIYELQMMGVMENEISAMTIQPLNFENNTKSVADAMDDYDGGIFKPVDTNSQLKAMVLPTPKPRKISGDRLLPDRMLKANNMVRKMQSTESLINRFPVNNVASSDSLEVVSATTSNVMGVTSGKPNVSAFSSLLTISKTKKSKSPQSTAFNFMKRIISSPLPGAATPSQTVDEPLRLDSASTISSSAHQEKDNKRTGLEGSPILKPVAPWNIKLATSDADVSDEVVGSSLSNNERDHKNLLVSPRAQSDADTRRLSSQLKRSNDEERSFYMLNSYWTKVENPSNAITSELLGMVTYGRWQFVFPPNVKRRSIKWTSISSPASLPIKTPVFPTVNDFNQNFTFRIYDVFLNNEDINHNRSSETLMRQMIALRLTLGFQICVGENVNNVENQRKPNGDSRLLITVLNKKNVLGARIYMSMSHEIHRISCDYNGLVNVQVYKRTSNEEENNFIMPLSDYVPSVRTRYAEKYSLVHIPTFTESLRNYNWNQLDQMQAGYDDSSDEDISSKSHRIKFVILPTKVPHNALKLSNSSEVLNPEEVRLDGIRALINTVHRSRYRTAEERQKNRGGSGRAKDEMTPEINFYTGSLFTYLKDVFKELSSGEKNKSNLFEETKLDKSTPYVRIAQAMQSDKGIPLVDRVWHKRIHKNCFLAAECVNWILQNFDDIETREQAIEYGNLLMTENVIEHVESKHTFIDGHYFYHFKPEYTLESIKNRMSDEEQLAPVKTSSSSGKNVSLASPSVNPAEDNKDVDSLRRTGSVNHPNLNEPSSSASMPTASAVSTTDSPLLTGSGSILGGVGSETSKEKVVLSKKILCDLDPHSRSWQPELLNVHYDIVHNPEHCFHLRLEWLNTTSKLIEDTVNSWAKLCERYGLTLVETPWQELCTLPERNPLHSSVDIELALNPWQDEDLNVKELLEESYYFYHMYLLEKSGFLLDNRTAIFFKDDSFDVTYSWGKPTFKYAQYIHKTGAYIAELRNNGAFFLAPNNAHIARVNLNIGSQQQNNNSSSAVAAVYLDSQSVMLDFRSVCQDKDRLKKLFSDAKNMWEVSRDIEAALHGAGIVKI